MEKGHYGKYTGNARCCMNHAHTKVTSRNYKATERDDAAHISYLKQDIDYDAKHGHSDEKMTADEKHISKLAGDMKYDKKHHSSPAKMSRKKYDRKMDRAAELDEKSFKKEEEKLNSGARLRKRASRIRRKLNINDVKN